METQHAATQPKPKVTSDRLSRVGRVVVLCDVESM
jgi:hypothetical protein